MCELKSTNSNELQVEFADEENISNNEKGRNKKKLKEILKRVYIGICEDSKNILLMKNTGITHILIIRSSKENNIARIMFPHDFEYYIIDIKEDFDFTVYSHFKCLLDDILFENQNNKLFIHSYFNLNDILYLIIFYINVTLNCNIDDAYSYIKKLFSNFVIPIDDFDQIYYFTKRHMLTYYPGECTTYFDAKDRDSS
ncbi:conserved Plasmodium protein, unknown function [Plasmodium berghei]|uniref:Dual specificity protein phosphatase n=2 Tax=Plasmodium berghei TaxID=5821 RepID=A0A509AGY0_PLABA|nr:conserved Plasmodium protein, unknown function [Plasmodium berghei ANKA]CXI12821.1 conserved Plasmodium protein, unknown function [Plasmodium berghei]SCL93409.1 conserved Plasmodium protein, unknown function [Plasmodium berghei]SCM15856.1 conserved Plasmodium protein, unknown function [Plasmodium berghei]SCM17652.1 conserved Plasmodium protein, unknown function [Plasmodium berghei]SCN23181.1 conserved Plasmodium protein, unknown function [Plasmodium berghei]|eukprot:XP_034420460.1 conserved Plasmodium protein, unknown function [Plasmodium berghei ANKA]